MHAHHHAGMSFFTGADFDFFDFEFARSRDFLNAEQFDFKFERGVGRNHAARAVFAVGVFGSDHKLALAAHLHAGKAFVPAADHLTGAEREFKGLAAVKARVKHRAVGEFARVVHADAAARAGKGAFAHDKVGNLQGFGHFDFPLGRCGPLCTWALSCRFARPSASRQQNSGP